MAYPNTKQTPIEIAPLPDWASGVMLGFEFRTTTIGTLSGWKQTVRQWARCRHRQEIQRSTESEADNEALSFTRVDQTQTPVKFPLWGYGTPMANTQTDPDQVTTDIGIPEQIEVGDRVVFHDPDTGTQWRTVASMNDSRRVIGLEPEPGAANFPQGAWLFPTTVGTMSLSDRGRALMQTRASRETLTFMEI